MRSEKLRRAGVGTVEGVRWYMIEDFEFIEGITPCEVLDVGGCVDSSHLYQQSENTG